MPGRCGGGGVGWPGDSGIPNDRSISLIQQISKHIFTTIATDLAI